VYGGRGEVCRGGKEDTYETSSLILYTSPILVFLGLYVLKC
jgi:hypothetical protein